VISTSYSWRLLAGVTRTKRVGVKDVTPFFAKTVRHVVALFVISLYLIFVVIVKAVV
jgi:hypothetical protein